MAWFSNVSVVGKAPALALTVLSIILSIAITACAGHVLQTFTSEQTTNPWWLPVWPQHFDTRGLKALIGTSVPIFIFNIVALAATFGPATVARFAPPACASLTAFLALFAIIFPAVVNNAAPGRDTMQTWTCRWSSSSLSPDTPGNFGPLCRESRFAYFTTVPVFIVQLLLLGLAVQTLRTRITRSVHGKGEELESIDAPYDGSERSVKHSVQISGREE